MREFRLLLIVLTLFTFIQCNSTVKRGVQEAQPALEELLRKTAVIKDAAISVRVSKGKVPAPSQADAKKIERLIEELRKIEGEPVPASPELDRRLEETKRELQRAKLEWHGNRIINDIVSTPREPRSENSDLENLLHEVLCLNLEAAKEGREPTNREYEKLAINAVIPIEEQEELREKGRALHEIAQDLYEGRLSDAAYDSSVTLYCTKEAD